MSAFMVSPDHVDAILSWVAQCDRYPFALPCGANVTRPSPDNLTAIGRELLSENMKSIRWRYPDDLADGLDVNGYTWRRDDGFGARLGRDHPVAVIKLCDCLEYQSCEHPGWRESYARRFLDAVRVTAWQSAPGYDAAPWHYERPAAPARVARRKAVA